MQQLAVIWPKPYRPVSDIPDNKVSLEVTFDPDPLYSLTLRRIVDAMFAEHGMTNPQDLAVLRAPLH
jgi:hypothetical protein